MMTIEPAHKIDVFNVAKDMRTSDYDEFSAVSFEDNRTSLARLLAERLRDVATSRSTRS